MDKLFRQEAIDHQRVRLWGEVLIVQPQSFKWLVMVFLIAIAAVALFASLQSYQRKETVSGFLMPSAGLVKANSDRGGIATKILVQNGQLVERGQSLIEVTLPRKTATGENNNRTLKASLRRELSATRKHLSHLDERFKHEVSNLRQQRAGRQTEIHTLKAELNIIRQQQTLAASQRQGAEQLKHKGFASKTMVDNLFSKELDLRQQLLGRQRLIDSTKINIANLNNEITVNTPHRFEEERMSLDRRQESLTRELAGVELSSAYVITAAVQGLVGDLIIHPGETVTPGRSLLTLRPKGSLLIARLLVPSRAAGLVATGQEVKIQYDAFPYQRFGVFKGRVLQVSQGVLTPSEMPVPVVINEAFYLVDIELATQTITAMGKPALLKPGMQLKADIVLEERSLLEWIFEPLLTITGRL